MPFTVVVDDSPYVEGTTQLKEGWCINQSTGAPMKMLKKRMTLRVRSPSRMRRREPSPEVVVPPRYFGIVTSDRPHVGLKFPTNISVTSDGVEMYLPYIEGKRFGEKLRALKQEKDPFSLDVKWDPVAGRWKSSRIWLGDMIEAAITYGRDVKGMRVELVRLSVDTFVYFNVTMRIW